MQLVTFYEVITCLSGIAALHWAPSSSVTQLTTEATWHPVTMRTATTLVMWLLKCFSSYKKPVTPSRPQLMTSPSCLVRRNTRGLEGISPRQQVRINHSRIYMGGKDWTQARSFELGMSLICQKKMLYTPTIMYFSSGRERIDHVTCFVALGPQWMSSVHVIDWYQNYRFHRPSTDERVYICTRKKINLTEKAS